MIIVYSNKDFGSTCKAYRIQFKIFNNQFFDNLSKDRFNSVVVWLVDTLLCTLDTYGGICYHHFEYLIKDYTL